MVFAVSLLSCCTLCSSFIRRLKLGCFALFSLHQYYRSAHWLAQLWSSHWVDHARLVLCALLVQHGGCCCHHLVRSLCCMYAAYFNQSLFAACLCFVFTRVKLSKQANHKLLFTHVYFCFQALLLFWCLGFEKKIHKNWVEFVFLQKIN